jgi:hypothetical protein
VSDLFHRALARPPEERSAFLADACADDAGLREENESQLTSPTRVYDNAHGWSVSDGRYVVASSARYKPGHSTIVLVPLSAKPKAEHEAIVVTESPDFTLWNTTMSPNGRWVCFQAVDRGGSGSKIVVVSREGGPWKDITDGAFWDDKPRWSPDGRLIYFISDRGGLFNIWAIGFDATTGSPVGEPVALTTFNGAAEHIPDNVGIVELGVARGRLAIPVINPTGGIWMLENLRR